MSDDTPPDAPRFSVLVPNRNHGRFVGRAIDSVLQQDWPAALREVVVVDDGSSDDSRDRLAAYAGRADVKIVLQDNRGQTAAFAAALAQADGDYVCLLDADDTCLPQRLRRVAEHLALLQAEPATLFLCHDMLVINGVDGEPIARTWFDEINLRRLGPQLHAASAYHPFPFAATSGMVFGRELLQRLMAEVPTFEWPIGSDAVLGHGAMLLAGEVHYLHEALVRYVVHGRNNLATIEDGVFRARPIWQQRWPKLLRFLELLADRLPLPDRERADRIGYVRRLEHASRLGARRPHHRPLLLSFIVDASAETASDRLAATAAAIEAQRSGQHEVVWLLGEGVVDLFADAPGHRAVRAPDGTLAYYRLQAGLQAAKGGFVAFLQAGDIPDPDYAERHLDAHRHGNLPMLTACDLRLLDAEGTVVHPCALVIGQRWGALPQQAQAFGLSLRDWGLAPLAATVFRRTTYMDAFFALPQWPLHERHAGWLWTHYAVLLGGGARLSETLIDIHLPAGAVANASWLSQFVDREGPLPAPDLPRAAETLFEAYARGRRDGHASFAEAWEAHFLRWLLQAGGPPLAPRLAQLAQQCGDAPLAARVQAMLRSFSAR